MILLHRRVEIIGDLAVLRWTVQWEQRQAPPADLYIAVPADYSDLLADDDHGPLLASLASAARHGEERIVVDAADPLLLEGIAVAQRYHEHWQSIRPVRVDAGALRASATPEDRDAATLLSGGVDSLSTLRGNLDRYPIGHHARATHAINVEMRAPVDLEDLNGTLPARQREVANLLRVATDDVGINLIPVATNVRSLDGYDFNTDWMFHAHGTVFAGIAHALSGGFSRVFIGSTYDIPNMSPWGSHPLIDSRLTSSAMSFHHHNEHLSRQEKVRLISDWDAALRVIDVCFRYLERDGDGPRNCGVCEKCQRTMAGLLACGISPGEVGAFIAPELSDSTLARLGRFKDDYERSVWAQLLDEFREQGLPQRRGIEALLRRDRAATRIERTVGGGPVKLAKKIYRRVRPAV